MGRIKASPVSIKSRFRPMQELKSHLLLLLTLLLCLPRLHNADYYMQEAKKLKHKADALVSLQVSLFTLPGCVADSAERWYTRQDCNTLLSLINSVLNDANY